MTVEERVVALLDAAAALERLAEDRQRAARHIRTGSILWRLLAEEELLRARADELLVLAHRLREEARDAARTIGGS